MFAIADSFGHDRCRYMSIIIIMRRREKQFQVYPRTDQVTMEQSSRFAKAAYVYMRFELVSLSALP
jgi:hypothetical protein